RSRGMPVTDPYTGRINAYLEGGEGIANKRTMADKRRYKVEGTPSQIMSMLNAKHGGVHWESGATLVPAWTRSKSASMNFANIRKYAQGGVFESKQPPAGNEASVDVLKSLGETLTAMNSTMVEMRASIDEMNNTLSRGIYSRTLITEFEDQQERLDD